MQNHLQLAAPGGGKIFPLLFEETAESRDEHFPANNDGSHQCGDAGLSGAFHQKNERAADDDLVGKRVNDAAERADEVVAAASPNESGQTLIMANKMNARNRRLTVMMLGRFFHHQG